MYDEARQNIWFSILFNLNWEINDRQSHFSLVWLEIKYDFEKRRGKFVFYIHHIGAMASLLDELDTLVWR